MEPLFRYAPQGFHQSRSPYQKYQQRLNRGSSDQLCLKLNVYLNSVDFCLDSGVHFNIVSYDTKYTDESNRKRGLATIRAKIAVRFSKETLLTNDPW
jgi:hypothetical protein